MVRPAPQRCGGCLREGVGGSSLATCNHVWRALERHSSQRFIPVVPYVSFNEYPTIVVGGPPAWGILLRAVDGECSHSALHSQLLDVCFSLLCFQFSFFLISLHLKCVRCRDWGTRWLGRSNSVVLCFVFVSFLGCCSPLLKPSVLLPTHHCPPAQSRLRCRPPACEL